MKVEIRPKELRLEQIRVNEAEEKLHKAFPDSVLKSKLRKFPRALAAEAVEYKTLPEKYEMKEAADRHDAARILIFGRVNVILEAEADRQALLWKELLDVIVEQRQVIVKAMRNKKRRQRKLIPLHLLRELDYIDEQIQLVQFKMFESSNAK